MTNQKKTKFSKPRPRPKWLEEVRVRMERDWGKCVTAKKLVGREWHFSCIACRVGLAMRILDEAYGVGDREVLKL